MKDHRDTTTEAIIRIRDMLLAHQALGRDLEEVIAYMQRTIKRRLQEDQQ
jgi:hypothetical protein